ncbi:MAG: hypothetical protein AVDCRST_MAG76-2976, partial [uncultured Acidimicrobiales bacterium]
GAGSIATSGHQRRGIRIRRVARHLPAAGRPPAGGRAVPL